MLRTSYPFHIRHLNVIYNWKLLSQVHSWALLANIFFVKVKLHARVVRWLSRQRGDTRVGRMNELLYSFLSSSRSSFLFPNASHRTLHSSSLLCSNTDSLSRITYCLFKKYLGVYVCICSWISVLDICLHESGCLWWLLLFAWVGVCKCILCSCVNMNEITLVQACACAHINAYLLLCVTMCVLVYFWVYSEGLYSNRGA